MRKQMKLFFVNLRMFDGAGGGAGAGAAGAGAAGGASGSPVTLHP